MNKKLYTIIILILIIVALLVTVLKIFKQQGLSRVAAIDKQVELINNSEEMYAVKKFSDDTTDGGGEVIIYTESEKIRKITEFRGLSTGNRNSEYFFDDQENLIYVYEKEGIFPYIFEEGTLDYAQFDLVFEGKYYFINRILIDRQETGQRMLDSEEGYRENILLMRADDLLNSIEV